MQTTKCDLTGKDYKAKRVDFINEVDGKTFVFDVSPKIIEDGVTRNADLAPEQIPRLLDGAKVYDKTEPKPTPTPEPEE